MNTPMSRVSLAAIALVSFGCGTKIAETATKPGAVIGNSGNDAAQPASCGATLASRLSVTYIDVDEDIRYKREGYDNIPTDARLAFGVAPSGNSYVAWTNNAFTTVHVTPLTALQTRLEADTLIPGYDIGGLVAQNDGFALLLNRDDTGSPLVNTNNGSIGKAVVVVRVKQGNIAFTAPLTGTNSIAFANNPQYDCAPERFDGRISFLGGKYGAYFTVHGCQGDGPHESYYADKLSYFDDQAIPLSGGWNWGCQIDEDLRLVPEATQFTALCMIDQGTNAGMNLIQEGAPPTLSLLATEFATSGFCSGQFGSIVKSTNDGSYTVAWLSRGGVTGAAGALQPAKSANDIALLRLSPAPDYSPSSVTWVNPTPTINEMNLHIAAYGPDRLLVAWDSVEGIICDLHQDPNTETCFGNYTGTHFRLMDTQGNFLTPDEVLTAPPNSRDDMVIFPNGDVGWAFVPDPDRNYSDILPVDAQKVPLVAAKRQIGIARLIYCPAQ
jgi:hypothetical protein